MHLRPISRDLRKDLFGRYKKSKRDRSPGCGFAALPYIAAAAVRRYTWLRRCVVLVMLCMVDWRWLRG